MVNLQYFMPWQIVILTLFHIENREIGNSMSNQHSKKIYQKEILILKPGCNFGLHPTIQMRISFDAFYVRM